MSTQKITQTVTDLNMRTIKTLEEKIEGEKKKSLFFVTLRFLNKTQKTQTIREKIAKLDLTIIRNVSLSKVT